MEGGKWVNLFFCPLAGEPNTTVTDNVEWNITIRSERWHSFNCESVQESAYKLRLATAAHLGTDVSCITGERYRTDKFILGQSFEKAPGQSCTQASTLDREAKSTSLSRTWEARSCVM